MAQGKVIPTAVVWLLVLILMAVTLLGCEADVPREHLSMTPDQV